MLHIWRRVDRTAQIGMPITQKGIWSVYIIADIYFFSIHQHKDINSFSFCWQSMVKEIEAFSKTKIKNKNKKWRPKNDAPIRIAAGRLQCINWLRFFTFLEWIAVPQSGGFFVAYGILLFAILICYTNTEY